VSGGIDSLAMLESQHREIEKLFDELEQTSGVRKRKQFLDLADKLAIHSTIEERDFYPAVRATNTERLVSGALEEHLGIGRGLANMLAVDIEDEAFDAKVRELRARVEDHILEEESHLFPEVRRLLDDATSTAIARQMAATQEELIAEMRLRDAVPYETKRAAEL